MMRWWIGTRLHELFPFCFPLAAIPIVNLSFPKT